MSAPVKVSALIAAGGMGTRLGLGPKALLRAGQCSLLERVVKLGRAIAEETIAAVPATHLDECRALVGDSARVIAGGEHRSASFAQAFALSRGEYILLLDVTRPFVSVALARAVIDAARAHGAAGAFIPADIPIALPGEGLVRDCIPARDHRHPQMPQALRRDLAQRLFTAANINESQTVWQLGLNNGLSFAPVLGEATNLKITRALDWIIARDVLAPMIDAESP